VVRIQKDCQSVDYATTLIVIDESLAMASTTNTVPEFMKISQTFLVGMSKPLNKEEVSYIAVM